MGKDWSGDANSIFKQLGASNHTERERERAGIITPRIRKLCAI